jgi:sporulation protein YlmC with PRC-barrel domain
VTGPDAANSLDRLTTLSGASSLSQVQQTQVVTESGTLLGTISQVEIDDEARTVVGYMLSTSLWKRMRHNAPRIEVQDVFRFGASGIMIVADRVGARLTSEAE